MKTVLNQVEDWVFGYLDKHAYRILKVSIGVIYVIFGALKFFPNFSPAEQLASDTICVITFDVLSGSAACITLAIMEVSIGVLLILNLWSRGVLLFTMWHMVCTFIPLILLPNYAFNSDPFSFSIVGQYIVKNLVIMSALIVLYKNERSKRLAAIKP
ncbi:MAG: doxx family protein [Flammeovirgaceae bacterium]|nr:doxx family protein [Flammeovirgaceae bacterium]MBE63345.1 doxx family protein [Flammeovirgaceae bacterium]MBR07743.1 doxx family protein [Rickettsiales bacterium]|tara:strand:- start:232 stop:702 length:471 start_codon:yes stop_codon:yes gene_type:complete